MTDERRAEIAAALHERNLRRLAEDDLDPADAARFLQFMDDLNDRALAEAQAVGLLLAAPTDGRRH